MAAARSGTATPMAARERSLDTAAVKTTGSRAVEVGSAVAAHCAGEIGPAVLGGGSDLSLVYSPEDLFAYRYALAQVLLARSGAAARQPPWLARGAALWLSGGWYGRLWGDWLLRLAAARALPTAEQLLAAEGPPDGSAPLWTPVAAAVVERLRAALADIVARPAVVRRFEELGVLSAYAGPAAFTGLVEKQIRDWTPAIKAADLGPK